MATPKPINGVPQPGHRGTRIPAQDPASRRAQRTSGPTGPTSGGSRSDMTGCGRLLVLAVAFLIGAAIVLATVRGADKPDTPQPTPTAEVTP